MKAILMRALLLTLYATVPLAASDIRLIVSIRDQKLLVVSDNQPVAIYQVSTSKFGIGDRPGSYATPLGNLMVREKIGEGAPLGCVFKSRRKTGEILKPNARGRDPVVTRILWLAGMEAGNRNTFARCIYIHGTPQEKMVGRPASYGCIRMRSADVAELYTVVDRGTPVFITKGALAISIPSSRLARESR